MEVIVVEPIDEDLCFPVASFLYPLNMAGQIFRDSSDASARFQRFGRVNATPGDLEIWEGLVRDGVNPETSFLIVGIEKRDPSKAPYLVHTGYELPLLLSGRKKLGWIDVHPNLSPLDEFRLACLETYVEKGLLYKRDNTVPEGGGRLGAVYYTSPSDAWRVDAYDFLHKEAGKVGGWSETFERMLGDLMGYSTEANNWWIERCVRDEVFPSGMRYFLSVTSQELSVIECCGFRALPWATRDTFTLHSDIEQSSNGYARLIATQLDAVAIVRVIVPLPKIRKIATASERGTWDVLSADMPTLNDSLRGNVTIVYKA
jgi:hypothetical protein